LRTYTRPGSTIPGVSEHNSIAPRSAPIRNTRIYRKTLLLRTASDAQYIVAFSSKFVDGFCSESKPSALGLLSEQKPSTLSPGGGARGGGDRCASAVDGGGAVRGGRAAPVGRPWRRPRARGAARRARVAQRAARRSPPVGRPYGKKTALLDDCGASSGSMQYSPCVNIVRPHVNETSPCVSVISPCGNVASPCGIVASQECRVGRARMATKSHSEVTNGRCRVIAARR